MAIPSQPETRPQPVSASAYDEIAEWYDVWVGGDSMYHQDQYFSAVEALLGDIESIQRALDRARTTATTEMESRVPLLGTTASAAPFIGLFGTVWGIMNSFRNIGAKGAANLATVAPGIAEALVATAIGLMAAIPAVMAYNYFSRRIRVIAAEMETFSSDFLNIVRRRFF